MIVHYYSFQHINLPDIIRKSVERIDIMRAPHRDKNGLKKGPWSPEEDQLLTAYIKRYKIWNWSLMPRFAGLARTGKSCRLRWVNYLNPELKRGKITLEEEDTIARMYAELGSRWSAIAAKLPGRTDNQIKNYWHTHLRKRFEGTHIQRIKATKNDKLSFEANIMNSDESHITMFPVLTTSEASTSGDSNKLPMAQSSADGESSLFSTGYAVGTNDVHDQVDDVRARLSKGHVDLFSVPAEPYSHENLYKVKAGMYAEEWYQEPSSPFGIYNNEYCLNILLREDIDASCI